MRCRRDTIDESVAQGEIHRYLADTIYKMGKEKQIYNRLIKEKLAATGKKIAIVGAGRNPLLRHPGIQAAKGRSGKRDRVYKKAGRKICYEHHGGDGYFIQDAGNGK